MTAQNMRNSNSYDGVKCELLLRNLHNISGQEEIGEIRTKLTRELVWQVSTKKQLDSIRLKRHHFAVHGALCIGTIERLHLVEDNYNSNIMTQT
jgi:hypothetical protein